MIKDFGRTAGNKILMCPYPRLHFILIQVMCANNATASAPDRQTLRSDANDVIDCVLFLRSLSILRSVQIYDSVQIIEA